MGIDLIAQKYTCSERMAEAYLAEYFGNQEIEYPINPFSFLREEGILFTLSDLRDLEGVYICAASEDDIPVVSINANRPITRQRFTAAHELCHHLRDADKQNACPINGEKTEIEKFAEKFAAALLMPLSELELQVNQRKDARGYISLDDVLEIADFFGVSFESCLFRIAYRIRAIDGDTGSKALKKRARNYAPDSKRKDKHMTYAKLYADLLDNFEEQLAFIPTEHARYLFQNEYIYNDSRMEGVNVTLQEASEIVTDLRLKMQHSVYCREENEVYLSIAGHYIMYQEILAVPVKHSIDIYETILLHKKLFSCYPYPEFGGSVRQNNAMVLGAKFETVDHHIVFSELAKANDEIKALHSNLHTVSVSEFVKQVARIHHKITVIHPFPEGNGRTSRAFMNVQLVHAGLPPIYITVDNKAAYIAALSRADDEKDYDELYEIFFKALIRSHVALKRE